MHPDYVEPRLRLPRYLPRYLPMHGPHVFRIVTMREPNKEHTASVESPLASCGNYQSGYNDVHLDTRRQVGFVKLVYMCLDPPHGYLQEAHGPGVFCTVSSTYCIEHC